MRTLLFLNMSALALAASGCASLVETSKTVLRTPASLISAVTSPKPVSKILCLWEPSDGQGLDERPSRGFAGQIMFFTPGEPSPIKVKGTINIYQYANFNADDLEHNLIHTFTFDSGAWEAHRTEGTLGHSYNAFLPYVLKDKRNTNCALRVELVSESGQKVSSPYTEIMLINKASTKSNTAIQRNVVRNETTRPKVHSEDVANSAPETAAQKTPVPALDTMTIQLPGQKPNPRR